MNNYIGPWWSDGKWQSSVAYGKSVPRSKLDEIAREHDTRYAMHRGDRAALRLADDIFHDRAKELGFVQHLIGDVVKYGNRLLRRSSPLDETTKQTILDKFHQEDQHAWEMGNRVTTAEQHMLDMMHESSTKPVARTKTTTTVPVVGTSNNNNIKTAASMMPPLEVDNSQEVQFVDYPPAHPLDATWMEFQLCAACARPDRRAAIAALDLPNHA